jgi:AraC-like DNA-binding protein
MSVESRYNLESLVQHGPPEIIYAALSAFDPVWSQRMHQSPHAELLHVLKGSTRLITPGGEWEASEGDILLIPTGEEHRDEYDPDSDFAVFMVFFRWAAEPELCGRVNNDLLRQADRVAKADAVSVLNLMRRDLGLEGPMDRLVMRTQLLSALVLLCRACAGATGTAEGGSAGSAAHAPLIRRAKAYIDLHLHEPIALEEIARALKVSPYHLSHVFSRENEITLFEYVTQQRMQRAYDLLREGQHNVGEVSRKLAYESSSYFARVFRKHFGCSPSDLLRR